MSHTDVHRPAWVKERDPLMGPWVVYHRHFARECWSAEDKRWLVQRTVPCSLEKFYAEMSGGHRDPRCGVSYRGGRNIYCGCGMCTGQTARKLARRQERTAWRAHCRDMLKTHRDDIDGYEG